MYPRNAASPERIAIGAVVQISDGAVQTTGISITVRGQGGAEGAGGGTSEVGASGIVYYTPTQAETNFTSFVVIASKTGCIPVAQTIITTAAATAGQVRLEGVTHTGAVIPTVTNTTQLNGASTVTVGTNNDKTGYSLTATTGLGNQTANITGNLSGSVGSVTGAVGSVTAAVTVGTNTDKTGYSLTATTGLGNQTANITGNLSGSVGSVTAPVTVGTVNTDVITAASLAADAVNEIRDAILSDATPFAGASIASIKSKTDQLAFTVANQVDSNTKSVKDQTITGSGTESVPWGPA